jgi:hypothetical protein
MSLSSSKPAITGEFEYVKDESTRILLINAYLGITLAEGWTFVKQPIQSFMFSNDPKMNEIREKNVPVTKWRSSFRSIVWWCNERNAITGTSR